MPPPRRPRRRVRPGPGLRACYAAPHRASLPWAAGLAAALAGLLVGFLVGEPDRAGARVAGTGDDAATEWTDAQTLVMAGSATTLDGIYLDTTTGADDTSAAEGGTE